LHHCTWFRFCRRRSQRISLFSLSLFLSLFLTLSFSLFLSRVKHNDEKDGNNYYYTVPHTTMNAFIRYKQGVATNQRETDSILDFNFEATFQHCWLELLIFRNASTINFINCSIIQQTEKRKVGRKFSFDLPADGGPQK